MGFGNLGGGEILVILLVALLVLGPTKLPEVARQAGKAMAELRKVSAGFQREFNSALQEDDRAARDRGAAVAATRPPLVHELTGDPDKGDTGEPAPADTPEARATATRPADATSAPATDSDAARTESDTDR